MLEDDIDTDVIFPARFLLRMEKEGLGDCLFADRRAEHERTSSSPFAFPLEWAERPGIILAGASFGCGSSREHAVWSLVDYGIRAVLAESFGEIFAGNAARNGLAAIRLGKDDISLLASRIAQGPFVVDLKSRRITSPDGTWLNFEMPEDDRLALMNGWDQTDIILNTHGEQIDSFENDYSLRRPWLAQHAIG